MAWFCLIPAQTDFELNDGSNSEIVKSIEADGEIKELALVVTNQEISQLHEIMS